MKNQTYNMKNIELLAAEFFNYSYDNYADHVEVHNKRFTKTMPEIINALLVAEKENWTAEQIAEQLDLDREEVSLWLAEFRRAKDIVFAQNASESFRKSVKYSIVNALKDGLNTEDDIDNLVVQICYNASNLGYLLDLENSKLSDYSNWLRREKGVDYAGVDLPNL